MWDLIPDVGELLLAQTYTIASRISQVKGLEAAYMIEGISEALAGQVTRRCRATRSPATGSARCW